MAILARENDHNLKGVKWVGSGQTGPLTLGPIGLPNWATL